METNENHQDPEACLMIFKRLVSEDETYDFHRGIDIITEDTKSILFSTKEAKKLLQGNNNES